MSSALSHSVPEFAKDSLKHFNDDFDQAIKYFEDVIFYLKRAKVEKIAIDQSTNIRTISNKDKKQLSVYATNEKFLSEKSNFVLKYGDK